jgi:hypothetical protein
MCVRGVHVGEGSLSTSIQAANVARRANQLQVGQFCHWSDFEEDELTLMETKRTRDPKNEDEQGKHNKILEWIGCDVETKC